MKYIDADILLKDIDEWENAIADCVGKYSDGFRFALEHFTFLITHYNRQEQQEVDLEKEINKWLDGPTTDLRTMARHFFELGKNSN